MWLLNHFSICAYDIVSDLVLLIRTYILFFFRIQQQQEVLAWLLEPLNKIWTQVEWQTAYLSDPSGLTSMSADTQFMWSIYHTVTFFEKALKRSGTKKSTATPQVPTTTAAPGYLHPMSSHLPWILPPLLRVLLYFLIFH
jgi:exportin-5